MKVKVESEKVGLKLNIQKTKIMASGPTTSWEIDGETVSDFIFQKWEEAKTRGPEGAAEVWGSRGGGPRLGLEKRRASTLARGEATDSALV